MARRRAPHGMGGNPVARKKIAISETSLLWWLLGDGDGGAEPQPRLSQDREEFERNDCRENP
jgi:hypothetical protein